MDTQNGWTEPQKILQCKYLLLQKSPEQVDTSRSSPGQIASNENESVLQVRLRCLTQSWLHPDHGLQADHFPSKTVKKKHIND